MTVAGQYGPWVHRHERTIKTPQVIRPYSRVAVSDIGFVRYDSVSFDTGDRNCLTADAAPIWWRGESDYPAWLDYDLPATPTMGEPIVLPYASDFAELYMPAQIEITIRHAAGDTSGSVSGSVAAKVDLRSGATDVCTAFAFGGSSGLSWGTTDLNASPAYADVVGSAKFVNWKSSSISNKQNLPIDNLRFKLRIYGTSPAYTDVTVRFKLTDKIIILTPDQRL